MVELGRRLIPAPVNWGPRRVAGLRLLWVCAALAYLAFAEWRVWTQAETTQVSTTSMGTGLLGALLSLLIVQCLALLVFGFFARGWPMLGSIGLPCQTELLLLGGATLVAFVLRFAALQEVPFGLWFDTAENGNQALRMLRDPSYRPVFIAEATQLPALFTYFDALSINWLGPEALAVRVPSALFGTLAIPAIWWLGRQLGGPVLGVAAAFALATSRWHLDFSRLAIASIVTPFALALALAATLAALRARKQWTVIVCAAIAGAATSLGLWTYPASILIVPALFGAVAWWVVLGWRGTFRTKLARAVTVLVVLAATATVTLGPLINEAIQRPDTVLQRSQAVAISGDNPAHAVVESALQHVLMFTARGDRNGRHNTPGRPELGWFAPFFLAGVGAAIWRFRSATFLAVPGTLLLLLTGILTLPFEAPQSHRAIMAVIPASLLAALPIALVWARYRRLALVLIAGFLVAGSIEATDYFRAQLHESSVYLENSLLETEAGRYLRSVGAASTPILAEERYRSHPTVRFLSGEHASIATAGATVSEFLPLDGTQPVAILSGFDEPALFDRARALYPQAPIQTFGAPTGQGAPLVYAMFVSRQLQQQTRGLLAESSGGVVTPVSSVQGSAAVAWSATLRVLASGMYQADAGGSTLAVDGHTVVSPAQPVATVFLARGAHSLHLTRTNPGSAAQLRITPATNGSGLPDVQLYALPPPGGLLFTWQIQGRVRQAATDSAPDRGFEGSFNDGRPWTAQWLGQLRAAQSGLYAFHMDVISTATLFIDDRAVLSGGGETTVNLTEGWHPIRIEYVDNDPYARLSVKWRPPGESGFASIPDDLLQPALSLP